MCTSTKARFPFLFLWWLIVVECALVMIMHTRIFHAHDITIFSQFKSPFIIYLPIFVRLQEFFIFTFYTFNKRTIKQFDTRQLKSKFGKITIYLDAKKKTKLINFRQREVSSSIVAILFLE